MTLTQSVRVILSALLFAGGPAPAACAQDAITQTQPDDLAAWRSPVAGSLLTDGEFRILQLSLHRRLQLPDGRRAELIVARYETPSGAEARSVAILERTPAGFRSRVLLNALADELEAVRVVRLGRGDAPQIVTVERGGSAGMLTLTVFRDADHAARRWSVNGVYQGRYFFHEAPPRMSRLRLLRAIPGDVNAYPRGAWRENYQWTGAGFTLTSRRTLRLRRLRRLPKEVASVGASS